MPNFHLEWLDEQRLKEVDCEGISKGLASIEKGYGKPFITKAHILQLNITYFAEHIPSLFWIHITREPEFVMQSILLAREAYYGSRQLWWSSKPREYEFLKEMDTYHQIAGQAYYTEKAIQEGLQSVPDERQITVSYEAFCAEPEVVYQDLVGKYAALGCDLPSDYEGPRSFLCGNAMRLPENEFKALESAYEDFVSGSIVPD